MTSAELDEQDSRAVASSEPRESSTTFKSSASLLEELGSGKNARDPLSEDAKEKVLKSFEQLSAGYRRRAWWRVVLGLTGVVSAGLLVTLWLRWLFTSRLDDNWLWSTLATPEPTSNVQYVAMILSIGTFALIALLVWGLLKHGQQQLHLAFREHRRAGRVEVVRVRIAHGDVSELETLDELILSSGADDEDG